MSLFDPLQPFSVHGAPQLPVAPPELRVIGQEPTREQLVAVQNAFTMFRTAARLSAVPNPTQAGRLPDGSRYRIDSVAGQTIMRMWPVSVERGDEDRRGVAWTSFASTRYLPLWPRQVVDVANYVPPDYPPPPEPPVDTGIYYGVGGISVGVDSSGLSTTVVGTEPNTFQFTVGTVTTAVRVVLQAFQWNPTLQDLDIWEAGRFQIDGTVVHTIRYYGENGFDNEAAYSNAYEVSFLNGNGGLWAGSENGMVWRGVGGDPANFRVVNDTKRLYVRTPFIEYFLYFGSSELRTSYEEGPWVQGATAFVYDWPPPNSGQVRGDLLTTYHSYSIPNANNGGIVEAIEGFNAIANAQNAASSAAYQSEWDAYVEAYRAWYNGRPSTPNAGEFFTPLVGMRAAGRNTQLQAVRDMLLGGIGPNPHLNARLLSFPFNIGVSAMPPTGVERDGGSITHHGPAYSGGDPFPVESVATDIVGARQHTVVPEKDFSPNTPGFRVDPPFQLRRDFLPPGPLFHWTLTSFQYSERNMNRIRQPQDEYEMFPRVWPVGNALQLPDYSVAPVISECSDGVCVIDHDVFVPPGTAITVVYFEYEVYDLFSEQWLWTPCPNMMLTDSVTVQNLDPYTDNYNLGSVESFAKVRACRPWKVLRQQRLTEKQRVKDGRQWPWSVPEISEPASTTQVTYLAFARNIEACPIGVVIAEKLAAWPADNQVSAFPFGARFIQRDEKGQWQGAPPVWVDEAPVADMNQFNWMALRALEPAA